ncbi:hypothetical protein PRIPAC_93909 [Pristionchus pacificus]|uniref:Uncharacterized protein n=1 Tax=Pristionchus pacificus TaxID=54126 RepID=A0A2A6BB47_PRIPA|nr:hypothetical protein PRIPAC_93909 [Pristionchus pacificus]|eukprot:PDM63099.1 hypothetical protein PRIPAC_50314 [Pristionchus pacificus]
MQLQWCIFVILLLTFSSQVLPAESRVYLVRAKNSTKSCKVFRRPSLHELMDRVCLMCHEMFSHEMPNMRSECRANCFRSLQFKQCLKVFMARGEQAPIGMNSLLSPDDGEE